MEEYKVGDWVKILKSPNSWNSHFINKCPLNEKIYPYTCQIKEIGYSERTNFTMTCGKYGWDMDELIALNIIEKVEIPSNFKELISYYY